MARALCLAASAWALALAACSSSAESTAPGLDGGALADATLPPSGGYDGALPPSQGTVPPDGGCGATGQGVPLHVADQLDLCLPPVVCTAETCPPALGDCVGGRCVFHPGYQGVATLPEAWVTYYCQLSGAGCHGITQLEYPEVTAQKIATARGLPLCDQASGASGECVGIAASPAMIVGNSQEAKDPSTGQTVADWGLGLTEASGLCYELTGPGGTVLVALTDRCGGYCKCNGSGFQECGPCVNATDMTTQCPCVGTAPPAYTACCGNGCGAVNAQCDWCASNNHPHFDLDTGTFNKLCAGRSSQGSCKLTGARFVHCLDVAGWPPGGGGGGACGKDSFHCASPAPHQDQVPSTSCCCNWNECPQSGGGCAPAPSACKAGSCACPSSGPDATHAQVPSTGCCCLGGLAPQSDGTCN